MIKIAISGKANTGKNTLANLLAKEIEFRLGPKWEKCKFMAFANPIKEIGMKMFPNLPRKYFYGPSEYRSYIIPNAFKNTAPLTVRSLLTDIGTQAREYNPNIWIDLFDKRLSGIKKSSLVIACDTRFRDEFEYLKTKDFFQIRLYRNNDVKIHHVSELNQEQIKDEEFDDVIDNNGELCELMVHVRRIVDLVTKS